MDSQGDKLQLQGQFRQEVIDKVSQQISQWGLTMPDCGLIVLV